MLQNIEVPPGLSAQRVEDQCVPQREAGQHTVSKEGEFLQEYVDLL